MESYTVAYGKSGSLQRGRRKNGIVTVSAKAGIYLGNTIYTTLHTTGNGSWTLGTTPRDACSYSIYQAGLYTGSSGTDVLLYLGKESSGRSIYLEGKYCGGDGNEGGRFVGTHGAQNNKLDGDTEQIELHYDKLYYGIVVEGHS